MKEKIVVIIIGIIFIGGIIWLMSDISKSTESYHQDKNNTILDCQNRGNPLDWCLEKFN